MYEWKYSVQWLDHGLLVHVHVPSECIVHVLYSL